MNYVVRPYPMKQYTIQDATLVDHGVFQLTIIMVCISTCCYLARDRGKQQLTLRSLSLNEESYQFVRMLVGEVICIMSGVIVGICGYCVNMFPFY